MKTIAVINQKGGVGKTTTAVNLAVGLRRAGWSVGLIDLDPQAHATLHLGAHRQAGATTYDLLAGDAPIDQVWSETSEGVALAPATIDLAATELELAGVVGREFVLSEKLQASDRELDYVLIDCPPSLGVLTINALTTVEDVLLPLQPQFLALHGLSKLMQTVELVAARLNPQLKMSGIVFCMYESTARLSREVVADVESHVKLLREQGGPWQWTRLFECRIRRNVRLAEAPSHGVSIFQYDPKCRGAEDYRALTGELMAYFAGRSIAVAA